MKILKSWGTEGQVVISLLASDPEELETGKPVFIEFDGLPVPFFVESCARKGNRLVVKFEDVDSGTAAEELVGRNVIPDGESLGEDEDSVIGMTVVNAVSGETIGDVVSADDFSGNTCITVNHCGEEVMIPFHEDLIVGVKDDKIFMTIPDGLI